MLSLDGHNRIEPGESEIGTLCSWNLRLAVLKTRMRESERWKIQIEDESQLKSGRQYLAWKGKSTGRIRSRVGKWDGDLLTTYL